MLAQYLAQRKEILKKKCLFEIICLKLITERSMGRDWGSMKEGSGKAFRDGGLEFGIKG